MNQDQKCTKFLCGGAKTRNLECMKRAHIMIADDLIAHAVQEQIKLIATLAPLDSCDVVITDTVTLPLPSAPAYVFLSGMHPQTDVPSLHVPLPLRLGRVMDAVLYITLARAKRDHQRTKMLYLCDATLDAQSGVLKINDKTLRLTDREVDMIMALYHAPHHTLDRATLLSDVWGYADTVETHTLEAHVYRLRQKLEQEGGMTDVITTHDGSYRLNLTP
jgi:hypothetical protein